jgi:hypothetical protein
VFYIRGEEFGYSHMGLFMKVISLIYGVLNITV